MASMELLVGRPNKINENSQRREIAQIVLVRDTVLDKKSTEIMLSFVREVGYFHIQKEDVTSQVHSTVNFARMRQNLILATH